MYLQLVSGLMCGSEGPGFNEKDLISLFRGVGGIFLLDRKGGGGIIVLVGG